MPSLALPVAEVAPWPPAHRDEPGGVRGVWLWGAQALRLLPKESPTKSGSGLGPVVRHWAGQRWSWHG